MKQDNIVQTKSYRFAVEIIGLYKELVSKKEYVLSKQILKSGTSVGANIEEAIGAYSKKDFFSKITISYKEARETLYWLKLLKETDYISKEQFIRYFQSIEEIIRILTKIQKTLRIQLKISY